jgi:hypothetical protein
VSICALTITDNNAFGFVCFDEAHPAHFGRKVKNITGVVCGATARIELPKIGADGFRAAERADTTPTAVLQSTT